MKKIDPSAKFLKERPSTDRDRKVRYHALQEEKARLVERRKIAQYLHDDLGQNLTSVCMAIERLSNSFDYPCEIKEKFKWIIERLDESVNATRRITAMLRPPFNLEQGLCFAVHKLLSRIDQPGLPTISSDIPDVDFLRCPSNEQIILSVYRVIQESLTNIFKHADANHVSISVALDDNHHSLIAEIQDDGCGFDLGCLQLCSGFGIGGMQERASLLGGSLAIESIIGEGTSVKLYLPIGYFDA